MAAAHQALRVTGEREQQGAFVSGKLNYNPVAVPEKAGFVKNQVSKAETVYFAHFPAPLKQIKPIADTNRSMPLNGSPASLACGLIAEQTRRTPRATN